MSTSRNNESILVTGYENPDIDVTACAYAYAEFLQKNGRDAIAGLFGKPHEEAGFVLKTFNISAPKNAEEILKNCEKVVLVDTSDPDDAPNINPQNVIEVIDHRRENKASNFSNAKVQIELVGSCATLIAEKFQKQNIKITKESAALLYSAIISNTINFKAKVTTERDKIISEWLKTKFDLPENYAHEMFAYKSTLTESLKDTLIADFKSFTFGEKQLSIAQIEKGFNTFLATEKSTADLLTNTLGVQFKDKIARKEKIIMRKEIIPLLKEILEK